MSYLNKVMLLGNLTRDPDLRGTRNGDSVCNLGLAVTRRYTSNGQQQEETCFVDITAFGKTANNCKQYLAKGSQVLVEGRLKLDQWEDRNTGEKRQKLSVMADTVQFIGSRQQQQQQQSGGVDPAYAPPPMPEIAEDDIPF